MPPLFNHITITGRTETLPYSTYGGGSYPKRPISDKEAQAIRIKNQLQEAVMSFNDGSDRDFIFIEIHSAPGYELDIKKFENAADTIRIASSRFVKEISESGIEELVHKIVVYLNKTEIPKFLRKIEAYRTELTEKGNPKNQDLIVNIEEIKSATLKSFWQENNHEFPQSEDNVWWELWIDRIFTEDHIDDELTAILTENEIQIGNRLLTFPEHFVLLIKGTAQQLQNSVLYYDGLVELRKPLETAEFFTTLETDWQDLFLDDLQTRTNLIDSQVSVCLLDSGITMSHQVLNNLIQARNLETINPSWSATDGFRNGHGTQMASLVLFGDLTDTLQNSNHFQVLHTLESVKIIHPSQANDPDLYGKVTVEAIASATVLNPDNKRIVCLAVTSKDVFHGGKPSSWSSAVDKIIFGSPDDNNETTLALISSGNLDYDIRLQYPLGNDEQSIKDPAQAFNAITVGSFTMKDRIDLVTYPSAELLAQPGQMSPCNRTSVNWDNEWARKPDIVMEGGNDGLHNGGILDVDSLKLLAIGPSNVSGAKLTSFGDTSASTALASKFIAELYHSYPELLPETIRALTIHSAFWSSQMLGNRSISDLTSSEKLGLIQKVGFGVPSFEKAKYSAENSLTLILERSLVPYRLDQSRIKSNTFHIVDLPWPKESLFELAEEEVKLTITLSYFIEPNPGNKRYAKSANYRSHGLRFKMMDSNESLRAFKSRVSRVIREEEAGYVSEGNENWVLGRNIRDKGSIHKDIWIGSAADLATRDKIAVHPVSGWWKDRKKLNRYTNSVRYSLVVSIESQNEEVQLYNEVLNQISVDVDIDIQS
jgi:hypothetical protein